VISDLLGYFDMALFELDRENHELGHLAPHGCLPYLALHSKEFQFDPRALGRLSLPIHPH
jgi:hypothetical protein